MTPHVRLLVGWSVWHNFLQGGQLHILAPVIALVVFRNAKISTNYTILPSVRPLTCPLWQLARWVPNPLQSQGQHDFKNVLAAYLNKKTKHFLFNRIEKRRFHTIPHQRPDMSYINYISCLFFTHTSKGVILDKIKLLNCELDM